MTNSVKFYSFLRCEWETKHQNEDLVMPEFSDRSIPLYYPKGKLKATRMWSVNTSGKCIYLKQGKQ